MEFFTNLWESVFTPGTTPTLVRATHAAFFVLEIVLVAMYVATRSLHFVAMILLASALWAAITWFIKESEHLQSSATAAAVTAEKVVLPEATLSTGRPAERPSTRRRKV